MVVEVGCNKVDKTKVHLEPERYPVGRNFPQTNVTIAVYFIIVDGVIRRAEVPETKGNYHVSVRMRMRMRTRRRMPVETGIYPARK